MTPSDSPLSPQASALERLPHLAQKICAVWGQPEFEPFVNRLIMDSRDGTRQGLPWEAALELLYLLELSVAKRALVAANTTGMPFSQLYEQYLAQSRSAPPQEDAWGDPGNKDVRGSSRERRRSRPADDVDHATRKQSWWRRLFE
jgi:hypothetical protein